MRDLGARRFLEHPDEAFADYRDGGVDAGRVRGEAHGLARGGAGLPRRRRRRTGSAIDGGRARSTPAPAGRSSTRDLTEALLDRVRRAADRAGLWDELDTDWLLLDAELLPWSAKAAACSRDQYAAVGAAARAALPAAVDGLDAGGRPRPRRRPTCSTAHAVARGRRRRRSGDAYRRYCWPTDGLDGVHARAVPGARRRGAVLRRRDRRLAPGVADRLVAADPERSRRPGGCVVDTADEASVRRGRRLVGRPDRRRRRGHGRQAVRRTWSAGADGLVQPGLKVRGREYLRIIYGPDYTEPAHLDAAARARRSGHKRSLALREYALGLEALDRLAAGEPLWRVHEAVFAVLALESEPVDPRL